jgi:hypothetical protein
MKKDFCDICGNEIQPGDLHRLAITRIGEKEIPSIKPMDICVFCKEKIAALLNKDNLK